MNSQFLMVLLFFKSSFESVVNGTLRGRKRETTIVVPTVCFFPAVRLHGSSIHLY